MKYTGNTGKLIGSLVLGTAIGAALNSFFSPAKGPRTRKRILPSGTKLSQVMRQRFEDPVLEAASQTDELNTGARKLVRINDTVTRMSPRSTNMHPI